MLVSPVTLTVKEEVCDHWTHLFLSALGNLHRRAYIRALEDKDFLVKHD